MILVTRIFFQLCMTAFLPDSRQLREGLIFAFFPSNYIYFLRTKTHSKGIIV